MSAGERGGAVAGPAAATRRVAEVGVALALATVLSMVKVFRLPMGGSVTLGSLVPLWLVARRHGVATGIAAGALHGMLQAMLGGYVLGTVQVLLDYPLAYAAMGLAGLGYGGLVLGVLARYAIHVTSGLVFFADLPEAVAAGPLAYSLGYNALALFPEAAVSLAVLVLLLRAKPELGAPR